MRCKELGCKMNCKNCGHEITFYRSWKHKSEYWNTPTLGCTDIVNNKDCDCTNPEPKEVKEDG